MSKKSVRPATRVHSNRRKAAADCINRAFAKSDIAEICHAIGAATRLYNISDLAQKSGLARPSIHRAFAGNPKNQTSRLFLVFSTQWACGCASRCAGGSRKGGAPEIRCELPRA